MDFMDERLRRKLVKRRGRLHAFDSLEPARTAIVIIDLTQPILDTVPGGPALIDPINALTTAARRTGAAVAWVAPLPPSRWKSATQARLLFGEEYVQRQEIELSGDRAPAHGLAVADTDWQIDKAGYSAFLPGNSTLPARLAEHAIDTVIVAGALTDICVASSARDAYESGYRVIVCSDAVAANEEPLHRMALRTLARGYADVRPSSELVALFAAGTQ